MYCEVYPLKRMPRRFGVFDYKAPSGVTLHVGDLVRIPFRKQILFGIVAKVKPTTPFKRIVTVQEVIESKFISPASVARFEHISSLIVQSPSVLLAFAFKDFKKRKKLQAIQNNKKIHIQDDRLTRVQVEQIKIALQPTVKSHFVQMSSEEVFGFCVAASKRPGQTLILTPNERYAELLSLRPLENAAVLHGKTPQPKREAILRAWRKGEIKTLVGTRQSSLWEPNKLGTVVICEATSEDYRFLDRNPRFDARLAAEALAHQFGAPCLFTSPFPFVHHYSTTHLNKAETHSLVSLGSEGERSGTAFLSKQLKLAIQELPPNAKALLFFNRKGGAKHIQCHDCGYTLLCGSCHQIATVRADDLICHSCKTEMWIPEKCPSCQSHKLSEKGLGNQRLKVAFQKAFPNRTIGILDKEHPESTADIVIATEYYFKNIWSPFSTSSFALFAELHFEQQIYDPTFHAQEYAGYALHRLLQHAKQQKAACFIQCWELDSVQTLLDAKTWLQGELKSRKDYELPPFGYFALITDEATEQGRIYRANTENLAKALKDLKKLPDSAIISAESKYI